MALDLRKHKDALIAAWKDVSNPDSSNTWVIFGYEGQTGVLKVVEVGDGTFEDMVDNLNSGKIQYAYCRVTDPNTNLPKFVLVNWQGDGAPDTLKGRCASHVRDVAAMFRGAHLTVNARNEADLDEDDVLKKVAKSSGAQYGIHKEKPRKVEEPTGPVGSVYKKTVPQAEIRINERDQFWEKTEMEEKQRRDLDQQAKKQAQHKLEQERRQREMQETSERERKIQEHAREVQQMKKAEAAANKPAPSQSSQYSNVDNDDEERRNRSESLRKQRAAEAASLVKQRENNPREMFKQRERAASQEESHPPPTAPKKLPKTFPFQQQQQEQPPPEPIRRELPREPPRESSPPPREPSPPPREPSPPPRELSPPPREPSPPLREPSPERPPAMAPPMLSHHLPPRQDSDEEEEEQDWDAPTQDDQYQPNIDPYQQKNEPEVLGEGGLKARAIYDYQATADDEVSFDPGDLISEIEQVDEGWWMGTAPNGHRGLFPANYVEII